jgi:Ribonuclease toxin, BrnT, of type II toxin-antitoxin system
MRRLSKRNRLAISAYLIRYYLEMCGSIRDERKNKSNRIKHGIWFEAQSVFSDPHGRLFYDPEHSVHEDRFILLGVSLAATACLERLICAKIGPE